ncbi:hypothetical protein FB451DRAFT_1552535 [Mycena latifolia]|nr:hypothetical protein FB451DRAFT_1552535 [Mycena latifolia]
MALEWPERQEDVRLQKAAKYVVVFRLGYILSHRGIPGIWREIFIFGIGKDFEHAGVLDILGPPILAFTEEKFQRLDGSARRAVQTKARRKEKSAVTLQTPRTHPWMTYGYGYGCIPTDTLYFFTVPPPCPTTATTTRRARCTTESAAYTPPPPSPPTLTLRRHYTNPSPRLMPWPARQLPLRPRTDAHRCRAQAPVQRDLQAFHPALRKSVDPARTLSTDGRSLKYGFRPDKIRLIHAGPRRRSTTTPSSELEQNHNIESETAATLLLRRIPRNNPAARSATHAGFLAVWGLLIELLGAEQRLTLAALAFINPWPSASRTRRRSRRARTGGVYLISGFMRVMVARQCS